MKSIVHGTEFLSKKTCTVINGFFILLVFLRHIWQYIAPVIGNNLTLVDNMWVCASGWAGQNIVVSFLLFSGYGVTSSIISKGSDYVKKIPSSRILPTLLNFEIAVSIFIVVNLFLGALPSSSRCILAFIGWESVGNSNWYIFCILWCYSFSYIASLCCRESRILHVGTVLVLCLLYIFLLHMAKPGQSWWYDTILVYPVGVGTALYRDELSIFIAKWRVPLLIVLLPLLLLLLCVIRRFVPECNLLVPVVFAMLLVVILHNIDLNIKILHWCGSHLFELYIYQRLPMLVIATLFPAFVSGYHYLYILACAAITVGMAYVMKPVCGFVTNLCRR